jgi:hypothetical protein
VYINRFNKAVIKVFSAGMQVMLLPMIIKNFIDKVRTISNTIYNMIDSKLEQTGYYPFFARSFEWLCE